MRYCTRCNSIYTAHVDHCSIDGGRLAEDEVDPLIGRTVDRYRVLEGLGRGGMGCVYRVGHNVLEHEYAMKVLFGDLAADHRVVERFRLEAKSISKMRHPNVVEVTDFGVSPEGLTFLVMELIHGRTLSSIIDEEGPLRPQRAAELALQIASGLEEAHRLGLVHRDIKPSNIMVKQEADMEFVKILDFGIVAVAHTVARDKITSTDQFIGTPDYMAPEQALGPALLGPTADLYSLGVVLYEMLTGHLPFKGNSAMEILIKHITEAPPPLPPCEGLEMLVQWLLEKSPSKRPQSGAEVRAELERLRSSTHDLPAIPQTSCHDDTLELYVDEMNLGDAQAKLREASDLTPVDPSPPAPPLRNEAPRIPPAPAPELGMEFEVPVTYQGMSDSPLSAFTAPPPPPHPRNGDVAVVGYEVLREKLDRVQGVLEKARRQRSPSDLSELKRRYEEMTAAVRPGLMPYRYSDLASKISKLEDDVRSLRGA